jgi:hypothetical protein
MSLAQAACSILFSIRKRKKRKKKNEPCPNSMLNSF